MPNPRIYQVDVFTDEPFQGNAAGVVLQADELTDHQMQRIARELNNSETAFVMSPDADDHDAKIRYFTPSMEVPTCGHATIAAHYVRAVTKQLRPGRYWHKIGIGRLPVDIEKIENEYRIVMTQGEPKFGDPLDPSLEEALFRALAIRRDDVVEGHPIVKVDTGASKIMVSLRSQRLLNSVSPNLGLLQELAEPLDCRGYFIFSFDNPDADLDGHCRMFAPQIGIAEDAVTGNGNGPLGAYMLKFGIAKACGDDPAHFRFKQGEVLARSGIAEVWVDHIHSVPVGVRVGGRAIIVFSAELMV